MAVVRDGTVSVPARGRRQNGVAVRPSGSSYPVGDLRVFVSVSGSVRPEAGVRIATADSSDDTAVSVLERFEHELDALLRATHYDGIDVRGAWQCDTSAGGDPDRDAEVREFAIEDRTDERSRIGRPGTDTPEGSVLLRGRFLPFPRA